MPENEPATPTPQAEPAQQATPQAQAEPATPQEPVKPEPDWKQAYIGLQTNLNKVHARNDDLLQQNAAIVASIRSLQSGQQEVVRATLGDDKVKEMAARDAQSLAQEAARRAATASQRLMESQAKVILGALEAAGVDPKDPTIDWGNNLTSVDEWEARVLPQVRARIQKAGEDRIAAERKSLTAKSQAEIKAEADALVQRELKTQDRIDTGRGTSSTTFLDRMRQAQKDPEMLQRMIDNAKSGRPI